MEFSTQQSRHKTELMITIDEEELKQAEAIKYLGLEVRLINLHAL